MHGIAKPGYVHPQKKEGVMATAICSKCGARMEGGRGKRCADCDRDAADIRLLAVSLLVPVLLALAVVLTGLPL